MVDVKKVKDEYEDAMNQLQETFKEFHSMFKSKVLDANKSPANKMSEMDMVNKLLYASQNLDRVNNGEGTLALLTVAIRELLYMRDRANELEYKFLKELKSVRESVNTLLAK